MKFTELKNVEIINCDYKRLRAQKEEIEKKNKRIKQQNKRIKAIKIIFIILWSLFMTAATSIAMIFLWNSPLLDAETGAFVAQFETVEPIWVKCIIESVVLLVGISLFRVVLATIISSHDKKLQSLEPVSEQIHFATTVDGNVIGNFQYSKLFLNTPYVSQRIAFSFDAVNESETECYSFANESGKWKAMLIPGLFRTIIDAGNLSIFLPYYDEDATVDSLEGAYIHEKLQRVEAEKKLANAIADADSKEKEVRQRLILVENQNKILEEEVLRKNEIIEKVKDDAAKIRTMYYDEQESSQNRNAESQKLVADALREKETLQQQRNDAVAAQRYIEEKYTRLTEESAVQAENLRLANQAKEESERTIEQLLKKHTEEINVVRSEADQKIQDVQKNCQAQLDQERALREQQLAAKEEECHKLLTSKDRAYKQLVSEHEAEITEITNLFEEKQQEAADAYTVEVDALRTAAEADREDLLARLTEAKNSVSELTEERAKHLARISQLEHNAKSDQIYHGNLEAEYNKLKARNQALEAQVQTLENEQAAWVESRQIIESQKQTIESLEERCYMLEKQKETLSIQLGDVKELAASREKENQQLRSDTELVESLTQKNASLEQGNKSLRDRNKKLLDEKNAAEKDCKEMADKLETLNTHYEESEKNREKMTAELLELQQKYNTSQNYITSLQSQLNKAYKDIDNAKETARAEFAEEMAKKREVEGLDFSQRMKEREEQLRKSRATAQNFGAKF